MAEYEVQNEIYAFSPFDNVVDQNTRITAVTMLSVYGLIMLTGIIGHSCFLCFITLSKRRSGLSCYSAYVVLANLAVTHLLYLITCLPATAYTSSMELVTSEWMFGDVACRLVPFLQLTALGVTSLSLCALGVDRFRSAGHVTKGYEVAQDSCAHGACKILLLWIAAILLACPELFLRETVEKTLPASDFRFPQDVAMASEQSIITPSQYNEYLVSNVLVRNRRLSEQVQSKPTMKKSSNKTDIRVRYMTCQVGMTSLTDHLPSFLTTILENYFAYRHWWFLGFYFLLPILFSLLFAVLIAIRLRNAVKTYKNTSTSGCNGNYYVTNGIEGGTLMSQRTNDVEGCNNNYPSDSLLSNRTNHQNSIQRSHKGLSLDRNNTQASYAQYQTRLSPLLSNENLTDLSPVVLLSNGSLRTIASSHRPIPDFSPQSPITPSLACASGVSVLSLAWSNAQGGTLGNASLPPHGRRRCSVRRKSSRAVKQTLSNASKERALNYVLITLVLAYTITQLPSCINNILKQETSIFAMFSARYVSLIVDLCRYFSTLTFAINPIVLFFGFKIYRGFLVDRCCSCC